MFERIFFLIFLWISNLGLSTEETAGIFTHARNARMVPYFGYPWGQNLCVVPSGELGACVPSKDCALRNGIPGGPCANGFGTCCVFMTSCGGVIRENVSYFVNPNHPDTTDGTGSCQVSVLKLHPEICQIRLDLEYFSIQGPEPLNHLCNTDQFLVSGGSPVPVICGTSNGDHMYIDVGLGQSNPIILTMITSGPSFPRAWRIRVSQIPCNSVFRADTGCLQYYTGVNGRIRSFNFNPITGGQLSNQDYSICIRTERNFCSIQYSACTDAAGNRTSAFSLSGNSNQMVPAYVGSGTQGTQNSCASDWLMIPCARIADRQPISTTCEDKICGGTFNAEISSIERTIFTAIRPFRLAFHTDGVEAPLDIDNKGFCLNYVQQPCTNG